MRILQDQPPDVVAGQRMPGEIALDPLQILAEAVDLAYVALDRKTLVLWQRLHREPGPAFPIEQVGRRAWRDQVCVQNRLDDVLQPRALADNLITPRHLPSQRLGAWIGDPDSGRKPLA